MEATKVRGIVLQSTPIGEYDRRVVLLTLEIGKITAFARSARRPHNPLLAATMPFVFGEFMIYEGRNSNTLTQASVENHFAGLHEDLTAAYTGMYLLEFTEYYTHEYNDEKQMLKLLYQSLRALEKKVVSERLIRCIFEWKTFVINGEYPDVESMQLSSSAKYALQFITMSPVEKLYTFTVTEEVLREMEDVTVGMCRKHIHKEFKTLEVIRSLDIRGVGGN